MKRNRENIFGNSFFTNKFTPVITTSLQRGGGGVIEFITLVKDYKFSLNVICSSKSITVLYLNY